DPIDLINLQLIPICKNRNAQKSRLKAFYHFQKDIEELYSSNEKQKLFICDRGSLDDLASWPDTPRSFFHEVRSSLKDELKRYDWVIALENEATNKNTNIQVFRDPQVFWEKHPNYISISSESGFSFCATAVAEIVKKILAGQNAKEIINSQHKLPTQNLNKICETNPKHHEGRPLI
ncbi:MAG: hypothetical protein ACXWC9_11320, partial [Pseudobdellovibrionaceae bacterium]